MTGAGRADVELRLPGESAYVSVLRSTTAGLAARLDFTLDEIEDLRMAVSEACALVLPAPRGKRPHRRLPPRQWQLSVVVGVDSDSASAPDQDSFGWQVLTTLAGDASVSIEDGRFEITLSMRSELQDATG